MNWLLVRLFRNEALLAVPANVGLLVVVSVMPGNTVGKVLIKLANRYVERLVPGHEPQVESLYLALRQTRLAVNTLNTALDTVLEYPFPHARADQAMQMFQLAQTRAEDALAVQALDALNVRPAQAEELDMLDLTRQEVEYGKQYQRRFLQRIREEDVEVCLCPEPVRTSNRNIG